MRPNKDDRGLGSIGHNNVWHNQKTNLPRWKANKYFPIGRRFYFALFYTE